MNSSQPISRKIRVDQRIRLERCQSWEESFHVFDEESALAVEMALAAGRPLLVRGEPGSGKSQLARAAAQALNRCLIAEFISSTSEGQDLLWQYDPAARLHDVQSFAAEAAARAFQQDEEEEDGEEHEEAPAEPAALPPDAGKRKIARYKRKKSVQQRRKQLFKLLRAGTGLVLPDSKEDDPLHPAKYISPGVLWWALDCVSARQQYERCRHPFAQPRLDLGTLSDSRQRGAVLLIDEIDKADPSLPNALLEVLGNGGFHIPLLNQTVSAPPGCPRPLVIVTTNEERELPPAFVRRCFVLHLRLDDERQLRSWWARQAARNPACRPEQFSPYRALVKWLAERGEVHFESLFTACVREKAAELLARDRREARQAGLIRPGQAEYLDMLRALHGLSGSGSGAGREQYQLALLDRISPFALVKHPQA